MNKTAVITGAASGLGFELARILGMDGYNLVLIDIDANGLEQAAESLKQKTGSGTEKLNIDLGRAGAASEVFEFIKGYDVDILVNNAGFGLSGAFRETDWEREEAMIYLHIMTTTHLTKLVMKDMLSRGRGRIMNIASVAAFGPGPLMSVYYSTKAYLVSFGRAVSTELKGTGISLTTFCPGVIRTNFQKNVAETSGVPQMKDSKHLDGPKKVAEQAYRAMMKGKSVYIPTLKNRITAFLLWLFPGRLTARLVKRIQEKIHK